MIIYLILNIEQRFLGAYLTREEAEENVDYDCDEEIVEYEIKATPTKLNEIANKIVIGNCLHCGVDLNNDNVYFNEENHPIACVDCASGRYFE